MWKGKFWLDNFHYISAIKREDILYTSGIVQQTIHHLIQVIFAINEKYFSGDKKIEEQLKRLKFCPKCLADNMEFLLATPKKKPVLEEQRDILINIVKEIDKMV